MSNVATLLHPGELQLRRLHVGESVPDEVRAHTATCAACTERLAAFDEEQRRFEAEVPFERFAAGVERAGRAPRPVRAPLRSLVRVGLALAACVVAVVAVQGLWETSRAATGSKAARASTWWWPGPGDGPQREGSTDRLTP